jgi:LysM repeat protein
MADRITTVGAVRPASAIFKIIPISPPGPSVTLLHGERGPVLSGDVTWRVIDRPRLDGAVEYAGSTPYEMVVEAALSYADIDRSIEEHFVHLVQRLTLRKPPKNEPPVVRLTGPSIPPIAQWLNWVVTTVTPGDEERNDDGTRNLAFFTLEFLQYIPPTLIVTNRESAAQASAQRAQAASPPAPAPGTPPPPSSRTYTVKAGDTLGAIATRELGSFSRWPEIASLNGIRDPATLQVGQVLRLP